MGFFKTEIILERKFENQDEAANWRADSEWHSKCSQCSAFLSKNKCGGASVAQYRNTQRNNSLNEFCVHATSSLTVAELRAGGYRCTREAVEIRG
ncbi:hypothetical protein COS53_03445 [Candidatus Shapirobacteria bacterium CG03_land_8_20_14_0_80_35_14]|uniref:Uncharacterized protein n=1 Tax=Candidatus Shapirobacteria bacterium CG03_land_8_20_14_0_80_35_14 TaxID=1974878 RepID=A0A2M7BN37_9BACT|nr:MAG: hypothetical protein COS53_03445 [Candidatus Shapirobacteria bacterium CG03_land_8_20_14_0_80_35_14]